MPYYVRRMRREDVAQVNEIDREAFPTQWPPPNYHRELQNQLAHYLVACETGRKLPETAPIHPKNAPPSPLRRMMDRLLGREPQPLGEQELVLGFAGIWVMVDEAHLTNIAVRHEYQGKGIGELLLISIFDLATQLKANMVTLEVRVSNIVAQNLYLKYGFSKVGLRRAYYTDNYEDALLMSTDAINTPTFRELLQKLREALAKKLALTSPTPLSQPGT